MRSQKPTNKQQVAKNPVIDEEVKEFIRAARNASEPIFSSMKINTRIDANVIPGKDHIRLLRVSNGLTQKESASMVGLSHGSRWAEFESGARKIDAARWELFLVKIGLHPMFFPISRIQGTGEKQKSTQKNPTKKKSSPIENSLAL
jgi:hypothetical protein